ncbi:MAG: cell division protein SepF [Candidatus Woesearchaeota archaeon]|nr:cell division protein SepF [Candidatus Woesearchaeota archaeon]
MSAFSKIKEKLFGISSGYSEYPEEDYVEIDTKKDVGKRSKILVKPFIIEEFADIKETLDALREGYTIALINIRPLKDKDVIELKRAVNKIKKTCDAIEGDIAGFGEDWIVVTPSFAHIYRTTDTEEVAEK